MVLVRIFQSPQYFSTCVTRKKGRGGGRKAQKRGTPLPFSLPPYPLPLLTPAMQATILIWACITAVL